MPGNNEPIFTRVGDVTTDGTATSSSVMPQPITAAAADYTGISTSNRLTFTADATNGGKVERLRCKATSTNAASVLRVYINNGGVQTTAANNTFIGELNLPATTGVTNAATVDLDYPLNIVLPPGFRIYVGLGSAVIGGWTVTPFGGKY